DYIKENESDFIQFKTRLLLKSTENDPIAKARLISDVIHSVSVIPDSITRSVYIKECSRLLGVNEEVLYTEVRKQKTKQSDDLRTREFREKSKQDAAPKPVIPVIKPTAFLVEELEFLRFLLKHCKAKLFVEEDDEPDETEALSVGEFMIQELEADDLVSENPLFQKMFYEVNSILDKENIDTWKHFIHHPDAEISQLATNLLSEKYVESKRWSKAGAYMEREEDILDLLIPKVINEYKFRKIKIMQAGVKKDIDKAVIEKDDDKIFDLLSTMTNLNKVETELAKKLGSRTFN
ncbi:MAG: hypothetical protein HQ522_00330, partial [Bacteroidetes bacterium]|nr:hypothetical protein [Bacteroidota bacterium]